MSAEVGEYKGSKVLTLKKDQDDKFPFSFGLAKAKMIIAHIKDIEAFVAAANDKVPSAK